MRAVLVPRSLSNAAPTARLVYLALEHASESGLTVGELATRTGSCSSAVKSALADLRDQGAVEREPHPTDGRRVLYSTTDGETTAANSRNA